MTKSLLVAVLAAALGVFVSMQGDMRDAEAQPGNAGPLAADIPDFRVPDGERFVPGRVLVKLQDGVPDRALEALNRRNNARVEERLPGIRVSVVDLPRDLSVREAVGRYESSPDVEYAEPDFLLFAEATPNDPGYSKLYGLNNTGQTGGTPDADVDAPEAWDTTTGDPNTAVAVIDTGLDVSHPDLDGNLWTNPDEIGDDGIDNDLNGYVDDVHGWDFFHDDATVYDAGDGDEHGTHVAGTIAAEGDNDRGVTGVNWQASIMPLKFLGPDYGSISGAVKAIDYAVAEGAKISNNSWGCGGTDCYSETLKAAIDTADGAGHLFVAAAGNDGTDNDATLHYPSSYDSSNIIAVAATNDKDGLASFSNYGSTSVDLGAPGVGILSTLPDNTYGWYNGTSMATPHVTGVAALIKSQSPDLDDGQIKTKILQAVDKKAGLSGKTVTNGRLNAAQALGIRFTDLSLSASPLTLTYGWTTTLSGKLTSYGDPLGGRAVILEQRRVGANAFSKLGEVTTASDGTFSLAGIKPIKHTDYRARFAGNDADQLQPSTSAARRVNVRVVVTLGTSTKNLKLGKARRISGAVRPLHGGAVTVIIKRNGSVLERKKIGLNDSRYTFNYKPKLVGTYAFFATYPKHTDHLGNRSPQKKFKVIR